MYVEDRRALFDGSTSVVGFPDAAPGCRCFIRL